MQDEVDRPAINSATNTKPSPTIPTLFHTCLPHPVLFRLPGQPSCSRCRSRPGSCPCLVWVRRTLGEAANLVQHASKFPCDPQLSLTSVARLTVEFWVAVSVGECGKLIPQSSSGVAVWALGNLKGPNQTRKTCSGDLHLPNKLHRCGTRLTSEYLAIQKAGASRCAI